MRERYQDRYEVGYYHGECQGRETGYRQAMHEINSLLILNLQEAIEITDRTAVSALHILYEELNGVPYEQPKDNS